MNVTRRSVVALFSGLAVLSTVGCSTQAPKADTEANKATVNNASTGEINLYSSRHYDTDNALYQNFTKQTGIKVNLIEGKADELIERIKSEGANSPADVLITVDAGGFWRAQKEGVLQPISSAKLESAVPAGVAGKAPHKENARKFVEYLATPDAQEIFANGSYEYPVVSGLKPNPAVASFGDFKESNLKVVAYGEKNPDAVKVMDRAGWK